MLRYDLRSHCCEERFGVGDYLRDKVSDKDSNDDQDVEDEYEKIHMLSCCEERWPLLYPLRCSSSSRSCSLSQKEGVD
jgi:hypothetical protein